MADDRIIVLDVEAADLFGVPIEVGFAEGMACSEESDDCTVISESKQIWSTDDEWQWQLREGWNPNAAALHGLSIELLETEGDSPLAVANWLNDRLGGARVFSDNIIFDAKWVDEIFSLASENSLYLIQREFQIVGLSEAPNLLNLDPHNLTKADAQMKREVVPHRAAGDAARLARFLMRSLP